MHQANLAADSHELRPLTGIRGFAAILVILYHFHSSWVMLLPSWKVVSAAASRGHLGVDLFFILSGFILSYVYNAGESKFGFAEFRRFVWYRLARILPNHVATLAFLGLLIIAAGVFGKPLSGDYPLSGLPYQLTLTHAWPYAHGGQWNYPAWTISAEWFAYLFLFPMVWVFLRRRILGEWTAFIGGYAILFFWLGQISLHKPGFELLQVSCEFLAGAMFFAVFRLGGAVTRFCQNYATVFFTLLLVILFGFPVGAPRAGTAIVLLFPVLLLGLASEKSVVSRIFSTTPALWLGKISYALYMSHGITQKIFKVLLPSERYVSSALALRLGVFLAEICIILICAAALYYLVEIPSRNFLRRIKTK